MKKARLLVIASLVLVMALGVFGGTQTAKSEVLLSNIGEAINTCSYWTRNGFSPDYNQAIVFSVPAGDDVTISSVSAYFNYRDGTPDDVTMSIYEDAGGSIPGTLIGSLGTQSVTVGTGSISPTSELVTWTGNITVMAGNTYILYASVPSGSTTSWCYSDTAPTSGTLTFEDGIQYRDGTISNSNVYWMVSIEAGTGVYVDVAPQLSPQVGMISISTAQAQPVYESAGGGVVRDATGNELWLPQDYDGNGFDTHLVMSSADVDGTTWYEIFIGDGLATVWIPATNVTVVE